MESGFGKLQNIDKVVQYFESLNIPFAHIQAPFVAGVELAAGLFIALGLLTRFASLPLIVIMTIALKTAKSEDIVDLSSLFGTSEFLYIVILVWLLFYGAPIFSLDQVIAKKFCKNEACQKRLFI